MEAVRSTKLLAGSMRVTFAGRPAVMLGWSHRLMVPPSMAKTLQAVRLRVGRAEVTWRMSDTERTQMGTWGQGGRG